MPFAFLDRIDSRLATQPSSRLAFWLAFAAVPLLPLGLGLPVLAAREVVALARDVPAQCEVAGARIDFTHIRRRNWFQPLWEVALTVDGTRMTAKLWGTLRRTRAAATADLRGHAVGESVPCWYDAERRSGLRTTEPQLWRAVMAALGGLVCLGGPGYVGAWALHNRGKTEGELLARAVAQRSAAVPEPLAPVDGLPAWTQELPLPSIVPAAGSVLSRRLEPEVVAAGGDPAWAWPILVGAGTLVLGMVTLANDAGWLWPFVAGLGLATAALLVHALRSGQEGSMPAPQVEVGRFALQPGERTELFLEQVGPLHVKELAVTLALRERVTHREADGSMGTRFAEVKSVTLCAQDELRLSRRERWQRRLTLEIPADAMCSFQSSQHGLEWAVTIDAIAKECPIAPIRYPLLVLPLVTE